MRIVFGVAILGALILAGCGGPDPDATQPPTSAGEPVFASEEEALAAAEEVFAQYVEATTVAAASGGTDLSGFDGILTEAKHEEEAQSAAGLAERGEHLVGAYDYFGFELQQADLIEPVFIQAYACLDLTNVRYFDAQGNDLTAESPITASPIELVFVSGPTDRSLLLDELERWTGSNFCD